MDLCSCVIGERAGEAHRLQVSPKDSKVKVKVDAAVPPDERKGSAFPSTEKELEATPPSRGGASEFLAAGR